MFARLAKLLLLATLAGCADELLIGSAHQEAGALAGGPGALHDAAVAAVDGGLSGDGAFAPSDAQQDPASPALVAAARALFETGAWLGQDFLSAALMGTAPINVQLYFVPAAAGDVRGMFLGACQGGCPFQQLRDAGTPPANNSAIAFAGSFTLYHINDAGLVLGALYTDDGFVRDVQFEWTGGASRPPIEAIFIEGPLGPITFVPLSSGRT